MEEIIIPKTYGGKVVTKIVSGGFKEAANLKKVIISDSITDIENEAFMGCENLTNVEIGGSVKHIGALAFYGCANLGTNDQWKSIANGNTWNNDTGNYTVYCTDGEIAKSVDY